jgi:hypothetical protein
LANDFSIIKNNAVAGDPEDYRALGDYWESLDPANRWGGHFTPTKRRPFGDIFHFERNTP